MVCKCNYRDGKKATNGNQIHVSQVPGNEQFLSMEITKLPVGKQLIEALATGPHRPQLLMSSMDGAIYSYALQSYQIYIISKMCLTSKACACPCYLSFKAKYLKWVQSLHTVESISLLVTDSST
jgi:hypothetical protein